MKKIGIIGYGALGIQLESFLIEAGTKPEQITYFDDNYDKALPFSDFSSDIYRQLDFYIGLGYHHLELKQQIINQLKGLNRRVPSFIHPTAYVHPTANIESGVYIYPKVCTDQRVKIGSGSLINNSAVISHDTVVEECCFIAPNVTLCGNVKVGNYSFIGAGVIVSNSIEIGQRCRLGIGTCLTSNLPDNHSLIRVKDKVLNKVIKI